MKLGVKEELQRMQPVALLLEGLMFFHLVR